MDTRVLCEISPHNAWPMHFCPVLGVSPDRKYVLLHNGFMEYHCYDVVTDSITRLKANDIPRNASIDNKHCAIPNDGMVQVFRLDTCNNTYALKHVAVSTTCILPDDKLITGGDWHVKQWDLSTGLPLIPCTHIGSPISSMCAMGENSVLIGTGAAYTVYAHVKWFNPATGRTNMMFETYEECIHSLACNGTLLAAGATSGVYVWDIRTGKELFQKRHKYRDTSCKIGLSNDLVTINDGCDVTAYNTSTGVKYVCPSARVVTGSQYGYYTRTGQIISFLDRGKSIAAVFGEGSYWPTQL